MARKNKDSDKPKSVKPLIIFGIIVALAIAIGIWVYLIRTNKFFGLGELLRPQLKDIPVICQILPVADENSPELMNREEINGKYAVLLQENVTLHGRVTELEAAVSDKKEVESKYKILLKEVEKLSSQLTTLQKDVATSNDIEQENKDRIANLVKIYESMEAADAAKVLEEVGELNIGLVVEVCESMKTAKFAEVMQEMSTEFAAILSERMAN